MPGQSKQTAELPVGIVLDGTEIVHIVQGGNSRKVTMAALAALAASLVPAASAVTRSIPFFATTAPTASEILAIYVAIDTLSIPASLAGSAVKLGTNPAAVFVIDVQRSIAGAAFVSIGSISIATNGTVTLATTGGTAKALAIGDVLRFVGPASADAAIANLAANIKALVS